MNGVHDLGGNDGFGPVVVQRDEPVFAERWEARVFGMTSALVGAGMHNVHRFRHAIERMEPVHYLMSPYYEHWLTAAATLLVENGRLTHAELEAACSGGFPLARPVLATGAGASAAEPSGAHAKYACGDAVRVRNEHPHGHTRCPRYVRGRRGMVVRVDGSHALPDVVAHEDRECSQFQYCVRFEARELWGVAAADGDAVYVDLSEGYLERP